MNIILAITGLSHKLWGSIPTSVSNKWYRQLIQLWDLSMEIVYGYAFISYVKTGCGTFLLFLIYSNLVRAVRSYLRPHLLIIPTIYMIPSFHDGQQCPSHANGVESQPRGEDRARESIDRIRPDFILL